MAELDYLDLDQYGVVVGIEVLELDGDLPFQALIEKYHVDSRKVEYLRMRRPSIGGFITHAVTARTARTALPRGADTPC